MPSRDEPLPTAPDDEIEEISSEFIVGEASQVAAAPLPARPPPEPEPPPAAAPRRKGSAPPSPALAASPPRAERPSRPAAPPTPRAPQPAPAPAPARPPRQGFPLVASLAFLVVGFGGGFFAGVLWERQRASEAAPPVAPVAAPSIPAPPAAPDAPKAGAKAAKASRPARTSRATAPAKGKGRLDLTAPPEAEVFLDGRRIGRGSMHVDVAPGVHGIEVRLGKNRVGERFEVAPNESWTYDVTPTAP